MLSSDASCSELLAEAESLPVTGWDFSALGDRLTSCALQLGYDETVTAAARICDRLLDLGTGGGEWLAALAVRPRVTVATESWEPNVAVARRRLEPLGIAVVPVDRAPENATRVGQPAAALAFADGSFDLICARHEAFVASEVARVLGFGGQFITQQVSDEHLARYHELLGLRLPGGPLWTTALAQTQLRQAGLTIEHSAQGSCRQTFADVGAFAWFLRKVPWCVPGFSIDGMRDRLEGLDSRMRASGALAVEHVGFVVAARKT